MNEKPKKWMQKLHLKKGALRDTLGVKKGHKIPKEELEEAAHDEDAPKTAKRARLALVFRKSMRK